MNVAQFLQLAFSQAKAQQQNCLARWNAVSWKIGSKLPTMYFTANIQQHGETDAVLRCVEDVLSNPNEREQYDDAFRCAYLLATYWIGGMYDVLQLLKKRKLFAGSEFEQLHYDFELLRMPLEKYEIAKDWKLKKQPLDLVTPRAKEPTIYTYDPESPTRTQIMDAGLSEKGSMMWQTIDLRNMTNRWIDRRDLSDRVLNMWGDE